MSMINNSNSTVAALAGSEVVAMGPGTPITKMWQDTDHIKKREKDGKKGWLCAWCNTFFVAEKATKALACVVKVFRPIAHVHARTSKTLEEFLVWYRDLLRRNDKEKIMKKRALAEIDDDVHGN